ncbi:Cof-type HAD-IIB family hydrolase [Vibrio sp. SS-MA-C1-2]|uniref:Cof-type HAD-IIB family hydrolase n=1 Tax=Vibrio sp. SS-MA-C1-2 TaxID=2908646 RepID=UPI0038FBFC5D
MNQIKFIATDMDGTLLDENSQLPTEFSSIYQQLKAQGIIFCPASGRQYYSLYETFGDIKDELVYIAENGTVVMHQGKELYSNTLDKTTIPAIIEHVRQLPNSYLVLCGKNSAYIETQEPELLDEFKKYYHKCQYVEDLLHVDDEFIKIAICNFEGTEEHVFPTLNQHFGADMQVIVSAHIWLDIMNKTASKGDALQFLQKHFNFNKTETMVFGDYLNDLEMLDNAEYSYAMANAHPKVKNHANYTAPSNQQHGVITILKALLAENK